MKKTHSSKKAGASSTRLRGKAGVALIAALVAALALVIAALSSGTAVSAQAGQSKAKKYKATQAYVVDQETGAVRLPTQEEIAETVQALISLGQRPAGEVPQAASASGGTLIDFAGGSGGVLLAKPNEDGTFETRCVFTVEEGAAFLGLVEDDSAI
jgi:hypothetical protein